MFASAAGVVVSSEALDLEARVRAQTCGTALEVLKKPPALPSRAPLGYYTLRVRRPTKNLKADFCTRITYSCSEPDWPRFQMLGRPELYLCRGGCTVRAPMR